jgi:protein-tyrosine sulfotransferase
VFHRVERSSDQVIKPVNLDALTKWVGSYPDDVVRDMANIAPMLKVLGYDPHDKSPKYGSPDAIVVKNTNDIKKNESQWNKRIQETLGKSDEEAPAAA